MTKVCGQCKNYLGGGDWGLSCKKMYGLTSEETSAEDCNNFEQETVCKNASRVLGGFRCSICGSYKSFVNVNEKVSIEEYVKVSNMAAQVVKSLTECPFCGVSIDD